MAALMTVLACTSIGAWAAPSSPATTAPAVPATQPAPQPTPMPQPVQTVRVTMTTSMGPIVLAIETQRAPITAAYFLRYVDQRKLDGTVFYRAMKMGPEYGDHYGLIQGGTRNDPKKTLPPVAHEPTSRTGLSHTTGAISLARGAPGSARGDFFIATGPMTGLDADPKASGDNQGFAVFGYVVGGIDIVRAIQAQPTSPMAGQGAMRGQMLAAPVSIISVRRTPTAQPVN